MARQDINFRGTSGLATDGAGNTYSIGETYPTTRSGLTFGWGASRTGADRFATGDVRIRGCINGGNNSTFLLDLPNGPGVYRVRVALGDPAYDGTNTVAIKDGATTLATISGTAGYDGFLNANNTFYTKANWVSNYETAYADLTFAGSQLELSFASAASTNITHLSIEFVDNTAPTLTSPTGTGGDAVCSGSVSTNEGNGTLYAVVTASATPPTAAQVKLGQDHTGAAALRVRSQAVSGTGVQNIASGDVSAGTRYWHYMHEDAATNQSTVASSASFVVNVAADTTPPTLTGSITVGTVTHTSIQITWPAGSDNVGVTSYETSTDGATWTDRGAGLTYTFTGMAAGTSYTLRVRAKDAAGHVSTPALSVTQSTSATGSLTSSPLKNNTGTLLTNAAADAYVSDPTTGALVVKKTGLTSDATTGVITFSDAALAAATSYRVVWKLTATGAEGLETLTAA